jgi:hypothetical protein
MLRNWPVGCGLPTPPAEPKPESSLIARSGEEQYHFAPLKFPIHLEYSFTMCFHPPKLIKTCPSSF